ncbi:DNA-packaging protein [Mesorhizobium australicum]|uniref:Large terminase phage packaging protein n=1 Tax=Mesorhizobium australicum TaxID=536018 RepID=A0A1X7NWW0_9HYPH|nr:terminase family protein [Mesorhizobium australicum]SMH42724.1 Large terminase phage packaging protein [Mesorhizobium australicum]
MRGRPEQIPIWRSLLADPPETWLVVGGRGAGKTLLGAEWVAGLVRGFPPYSRRPKYRNIALVGETLADVREVMIDGPSGIRTVARGSRPRFEATRRRLVWDNGAVAQAFSSEDPDSLRGPQFDAAWCDEFAKWKNLQATWDMLQFGLRLGEPLQLITTTPRPVKLLKQLMAHERVHVTQMRTADNAQNLAAGFLAAVKERYGETRLGRQELDGELVEDRDDALWNRAKIEAETAPAGELRRIVVAVDPPASATKRSDACGIVAAGLEADGRAVVLADLSAAGLSPLEWAGRAVALYHRLGADCIVAETNQGGDMVGTVITQVDPAVPVRPVRASRGKWLRAEPVAALYQQGKVRHAERFAALEDEMCDFGPDGLANGRSPDRVDALVWAVTELMLRQRSEPRVRGMG